jgi:DNA mismatch endonuclease, patch repair protein
MQRTGRKNTAPEVAVRRFLHSEGLRFRLNVVGMPGTPDIVLPRWRTVVFVHGCFWHGHGCAHGRIQPKTKSVFWQIKIKTNRSRDRRKAQKLRDLGWCVVTVWECKALDAKHLTKVCQQIRRRVALRR